MSVWSSLFTGSSGLNAFGDALGVVGDNIANVSTVGFKSSRASFSDLLGGNAANTQRVGIGVSMEGPQTLFTQGTLQQTGRGLDLAIRGNGFFVVRGNHSGVEGDYYSRDGRIQADRNGYLVNNEGLRLQGYEIDAAGNLSPAIGDLVVDDQSPPRATTAVTVSMNLDASVPLPAPFDPADPAATSNYATSMTVYDSLGNDHRVDVYFSNIGGGQWDWHAMVDGGETVAGVAGTPFEIAAGNLSFTTDGGLDTETSLGSSVDFLNATAGQAITFDFGDAITTDGGTGVSGTTQYDGDFNVRGLAQDGLSVGTLSDLQINEEGVMTAVYSNGRALPVARLALANFKSEEGLLRAGNQLFAETADSGSALVGVAASGGRGALSAGALEASNVDLGSELVTLIAYQRAFQANARTVSASDEMLVELANIKR